MKILQVNCVYGKGSTGKITEDIHKYLIKNNIDSIVCYGRGEKIHQKNIYKICGEFESKINHFESRINGIMYGGKYFSLYKLKKIINKEKPDIVHLQCINGYFINVFKLIQWLKIKNIKTVLTLHAEFMYTANCGHALDCNKWKTGCGNCPQLKNEIKSYFLDRTNKAWNKMKKAFDGFDKNLCVVSVSEWLSNRAKESPIFHNKNHEVVYNGLNIKSFHYKKNSRAFDEFKNKKIILHVTPYFSTEANSFKGGHFIIEIAKKFLTREDIIFVIAGEFDQLIRVPQNVILLGKINDSNKLAELYSQSTVTLLTSKKETFSMVTAESLCCGTPVIGFKAGAPEQIAIKEFCKFINYGDVNGLVHEIDIILNEFYDKENISKIASEKYSIDNMCNGYLKIYNDMLQK